MLSFSQFTGSGTWPYSGEVDVIEGVNQYTQNIVSIHTGPGCTFADSAVSSLTKAALVSGAGLNCDATVDTMGCGGRSRTHSVNGTVSLRNR